MVKFVARQNTNPVLPEAYRSMGENKKIKFVNAHFFFLRILLEQFNLLTGTVDTHNLTDMIHINNQDSREGSVI